MIGAKTATDHLEVDMIWYHDHFCITGNLQPKVLQLKHLYPLLVDWANEKSGRSVSPLSLSRSGPERSGPEHSCRPLR